MRSEDLFQPVKSLLQLTAIPRPEARLFSLLVLANGAIATAPPAGGLPAIAFDLIVSENIN